MAIASAFDRVDQRKSFRPDIQGLRAVAVILVVINHLCGWPVGGYVGVDVFFVISGYLISGQLVRQRLRTGRISFAEFYARRLRRIVPVATLVAAVTTAVGYAVWYPLRANQTMLDGLSSIFWVANWHFARNGTDYLQGTGPQSPFQHYWSLSVEEQFYIFWPWLVIGCGLLATRLVRQSLPKILFYAFLSIAAVSFAWAMFFTARMPQVAYFDTVSRAWEFALGAAVAMLPLVFGKELPFSRFLGLGGLGLIVAGAVFLTENSPFPGPWAVIPVLGAVLVIAGNEARLGAGMSLLSNAMTDYIGKISYSLYLWHFPVIIFMRAMWPEHGPLGQLVAVTVMLVLSQLSYHFVEEPVRKSRWLASWEREPGPARRLQYLGAFALAVLILALSALQLAGPAAVRDSSSLAASLSDTSRATAQRSFESSTELQNSIDAVSGANLPTIGLVPDLNDLGNAQRPDSLDFVDGCMSEAGEAKRLTCTYGTSSAAQNAVVIGDSVSMSWMPTITGALSETQWNIQGMGVASCGPYDTGTIGSSAHPAFAEGCLRAKKQMYDFVRGESPDLVFVSSTVDDFTRFSEGAADAAAQDVWADSVVATLRILGADAGHVVVLTSSPSGPDMRSCPTRPTGLSGCVATLTEHMKAKAAAEQAAVDTFRAEGGQATLIDGGKWFCGADEKCLPVVGEYIVRMDNMHVTNAFGQSLAPVLREALTNAALLD